MSLPRERKLNSENGKKCIKMRERCASGGVAGKEEQEEREEGKGGERRKERGEHGVDWWRHRSRVAQLYYCRCKRTSFLMNLSSPYDPPPLCCADFAGCKKLFAFGGEQGRGGGGRKKERWTMKYW